MRKLLKLIAVLLFAAITQASHADVTFNLDTVISGSTPSDSAPWLTATFTDIASDEVQLALTNNMTSGLNIADVLFNSAVPISAFTSVAPQAGSIGASSFQIFDAGLAAGQFNIVVPFSSTFNNASGTLLFTMSGTGLTADSFNTLSAPGGTGYLGTSYLMAAEVQGFSDGSNGSIGFTNVSSVPEPEIYAMMGVGLLLIGFVVHRRRP